MKGAEYLLVLQFFFDAENKEPNEVGRKTIQFLSPSSIQKRRPKESPPEPKYNDPKTSTPVFSLHVSLEFRTKSPTLGDALRRQKKTIFLFISPGAQRSGPGPRGHKWPRYC